MESTNVMCREDLSAIYKRIANYLTERSIPTPRKLGAMRKEALGEPVIRQGKDEWAIASVQGILSNDFYIGKSACAVWSGERESKREESRQTADNEG